MRRIEVSGLCLVALLVLCAVVASAAQAGEYGHCVKAGKEGKKYTGRYTDKGCIALATEAEREAGKTNKYEWEPGPGAKPGYTSKTRTVILEGAAGDITCKSGTDVGRITGAKTGEDQLKLTRCTTEVGGCFGAPIETKVLETVLIDHGETGLSGKEPAEGEAWIEYVSKSGPAGVFAEYNCKGTTFTLTGSLSGVLGENVNQGSAKGTTTFSKSGGEQDTLTTFYNPLTGHAETGPSLVVGLSETKYEEKVEIKA